MMLPPPAKPKVKKAQEAPPKVGAMLPPAPKQPTKSQPQPQLQQQPQQQRPAKPIARPPMNYKPPEWSGTTIHPFAFEVIKNGSVTEEIDLSSKPFFLIGRQDDVCDIIMQHPSISRQHAVIQNRESGEIYVYELGSTHGTFVNKRRLQAKEHVELSVGDVLRFGASTRLYCLQGPEDLRKEVLRDKHTPAELQKLKYDLLQQRKKKMLEQQEAAAAAATARLSDETCMWGEREDAQEEDLGSARREDASAGMSSFGNAQRVQSTWEIEKQMKETEEKKAKMSDRERKLLEKIEAKQTKLNNMQLECERISAKEVEGDLSEGQRNQLTRNETQMAKVREEMEALEIEMDEVRRTQARQRGEEPPPSSRRRSRAHDDDDSDEDEFFDRVSAQKKARKRADKKTRGQSRLPELRERKVELEKQQEELRKELARVSASDAAEASASASASSSAATLDPLDAFMIDNRAAGRAHTKANVEAKLETLAAELAEIEKTLGFAQPAYLSLNTEAVEATKKEVTQQPKPTSAVAAALGNGLVASARQHMEKSQSEPDDVIHGSHMKREVSAPRQPAPGSMAAAIAQAKATEHSEVPQLKAGSSVESAPVSALGSRRQRDHTSRPGATADSNAEKAAVVGSAKSSKTASDAMPDRVSTKDLIAQIAAAKGGNQDEQRSAHTGSGGLGSEPTRVSKSQDSGPAPAAAKRGRMIDGKLGGLQVMSKKQKTNAPQFGRGSRQLRDDEDALNSMSDEYGGGGAGTNHDSNVGPAMAATRETAEEKRAREEAEYSWAPPSQTSQKKMENLKAKLGY